jgi:hypothetical protein
MGALGRPQEANMSASALLPVQRGAANALQSVVARWQGPDSRTEAHTSASKPSLLQPPKLGGSPPVPVAVSSPLHTPEPRPLPPHTPSMSAYNPLGTMSHRGDRVTFAAQGQAQVEPVLHRQRRSGDNTRHDAPGFERGQPYAPARQALGHSGAKEAQRSQQRPPAQSRVDLHNSRSGGIWRHDEEDELDILSPRCGAQSRETLGSLLSSLTSGADPKSLRGNSALELLRASGKAAATRGVGGEKDGFDRLSSGQGDMTDRSDTFSSTSSSARPSKQHVPDAYSHSLEQVAARKSPQLLDQKHTRAYPHSDGASYEDYDSSMSAGSRGHAQDEVYDYQEGHSDHESYHDYDYEESHHAAQGDDQGYAAGRDSHGGAYVCRVASPDPGMASGRYKTRDLSRDCSPVSPSMAAAAPHVIWENDSVGYLCVCVLFCVYA